MDRVFAHLAGETKDRHHAAHSINESLFLADKVLELTQRPGKIKLDVEVDLTHPRKDDIRYTPPSGKLARKLREAIE